MIVILPVFNYLIFEYYIVNALCVNKIFLYFFLFNNSDLTERYFAKILLKIALAIFNNCNMVQ